MRDKRNSLVCRVLGKRQATVVLTNTDSSSIQCPDCIQSTPYSIAATMYHFRYRRKCHFRVVRLAWPINFAHDSPEIVSFHCTNDRRVVREMPHTASKRLCNATKSDEIERVHYIDFSMSRTHVPGTVDQLTRNDHSKWFDSHCPM